MIEIGLIAFLFSANGGDVTYTRNVRPLFQNRCSRCHDYLGDKNWQVYENAYNHRVMIKTKMLDKSMPPDTSIPQVERDSIIEWVNKGAKK